MTRLLGRRSRSLLRAPSRTTPSYAISFPPCICRASYFHVVYSLPLVFCRGSNRRVFIYIKEEKNNLCPGDDHYEPLLNLPKSIVNRLVSLRCRLFSQKEVCKFQARVCNGLAPLHSATSTLTNTPHSLLLRHLGFERLGLGPVVTVHHLPGGCGAVCFYYQHSPPQKWQGPHKGHCVASAAPFVWYLSEPLQSAHRPEPSACVHGERQCQ